MVYIDEGSWYHIKTRINTIKDKFENRNNDPLYVPIIEYQIVELLRIIKDVDGKE